MNPSERAARIVQALLRGPHSRAALCELVGVRPQQAHRLNPYLEQMYDLGCIYVHGKTPLGSPVFAMQPAPFHFPDAWPAFRQHTKRKRS